MVEPSFREAVSVVVCNYNGADYLDECLAAVATLRGAIAEVLVVDNASTDRSLEILAQRHAAVRVVRMQRNDGPCPARNAGMRAVRTRWVLALDNDAIVAPDTLERLGRALGSHADVAIVQPRSVFASEPGRVHYDGGFFHCAGLIALRNFYCPLAQAEGSGTLPIDCAISVALLVDREIVLAAGGYDENFFILFEDLDLSYRLRATGHTILSVEDAIVLHKGGTPGVSFREGPRYPGSRVFFHSRNRWLFLFKNYRASTLVLLAPALVLYECVWFAFSIGSGGLGAWLRGKWAFCGLLSDVLAQRKRFARARRRGDRELLVGGPLTITPALRASRSKRALVKALDRVIDRWWRIVRPLVR